MKCYVLNCNVNSDSAISMYRFPICTLQRNAWIASIGEGTPIASARVCSNHFGDQDFKNPLQKSKGLEKDSVPTLRLSNDRIDYQSSTEKLKSTLADYVAKHVQLEKQHQFEVDRASSLQVSHVQVRQANHTLAEQLTIATEEIEWLRLIFI